MDPSYGNESAITRFDVLLLTRRHHPDLSYLLFHAHRLGQSDRFVSVSLVGASPWRGRRPERSLCMYDDLFLSMHNPSEPPVISLPHPVRLLLSDSWTPEPSSSEVVAQKLPLTLLASASGCRHTRLWRLSDFVRLYARLENSPGSRVR